jgi:hypothetical protein
MRRRALCGGAANLSLTFEDSAEQRAALVKRAEETLIARVNEMNCRLHLTRTIDALTRDIKATMLVVLPPYDFTVIQTLYERERAKAFNQDAATAFASVRQEFGNAIQDHVIVRQGRTPTRQTRKMADNAWKWDQAEDRRIRNPANRGDTRSLHKGRPETYDPGVVWAFADAIARAAGREHFAAGHHGDLTITDKDKGGGPMFRVLVAAIQWAMTIAWMGAAPPGTVPPIVKPEGILTLIKRGR